LLHTHDLLKNADRLARKAIEDTDKKPALAGFFASDGGTKHSPRSAPKRRGAAFALGHSGFRC
jgi:hypothetical protein